MCGLREVLPIVLLSAGCARSTLTAIVPRLEFRLVVAHQRSDVAAGAGRGLATSVGAALRWQRVVAATELPSPYEVSAVAFTLPCADDDGECLRELAEAEASIAAAIREEP